MILVLSPVDIKCSHSALRASPQVVVVPEWTVKECEWPAHVSAAVIMWQRRSIEKLTGLISLPSGAFKSIIYELQGKGSEGRSGALTQLHAKAMLNSTYSRVQ